MKLNLNLGIFQISAKDFWRENEYGGKATIYVLVFVITVQIFRRLFGLRLRRSDSSVRVLNASITDSSAIGISEIVSNSDLRNLIDDLDGKGSESQKWESVIEKSNNLIYYNAKCCKPKDGPLKYISVTTFENCSTELLRDFYLDNKYRKEWDKTLVEHEQLQVYEQNGTEIGRTIKKFPLLTPREYVLAWRVWEGTDKTLYCYMKDCDHPLAPPQKKYVRVGLFRSGWRIRKVPGRDACEIKMVHQEDAGLNIEMAKLAFAKGIWSYVCKMNMALRKYALIRPMSGRCSLELIQKVPLELEMTRLEGSSSSPGFRKDKREAKDKKFLKRPSKKFIANGLLLLGGAVCLSRSHYMLGAKLAMVCILNKLVKHQAPSSPSEAKRHAHVESSSRLSR
ncbi:uncharacterized protein LOC18440797 [Amborella trichopoda]|uniref:START domain-containing protein n=1 Tax=Amborella trichopoda TaxID=13333 RepID=W1PXA2_AMBTC|nr:uncharacterized protein LOC18440797 [Amborella trichopoda]ERN12579.1 hypothetical protein AMTR_s00025p00216440 [Amborella trichopoda]|eukprot:XP_006850998.1 uncharacterized protein LOC18440797 [Amborella trichopoda]